DFHVTGVQTCALPICEHKRNLPGGGDADGGVADEEGMVRVDDVGLEVVERGFEAAERGKGDGEVAPIEVLNGRHTDDIDLVLGRSEERRVGKRCSYR